MSSTERFVALLAGIITIIGALGGAIRLLARISWQVGQLVQRFGDHVENATKVHEDQEERLRGLERRRRRGRGDAGAGVSAR